MADENLPTLRQLTAPNLQTQPLAVQFPELADGVNFELKSGLIHLLPQFHGLSGEDPNKHLVEFHAVCTSMKPRNVTEDQIKLKAFPFSLKDSANDWFYYSRPWQTVRELADKIESMPEMILKAMACSLDLEEDCFLKQHGLDGEYSLKLTFYPRCPNPDQVLGVTPHSDGTTFTMLLQDEQGLEIMASDRWFKVPVIPEALFLNVGDFMEIMSNGVIKSTLHRVVTNTEKERVSVAMFYNPSNFKEIGPVHELVTANQPQLYNKTNVTKYGQMFKDCILKGQRPLSALRLESVTPSQIF